MSPAVGKLPSVLGSSAALVVAFLSYAAQVSPITCAVRVGTAFLVFCAFGIVLRFLLAEAANRHEAMLASHADEAAKHEEPSSGPPHLATE